MVNASNRVAPRFFGPRQSRLCRVATRVAALLLSGLIAAPFTAPFSACSLAMLDAVSAHAVPGASSSASALSPAQPERGSHAGDSVLTEEQLKDDATLQKPCSFQARVSASVIVLPRPAAIDVTRAAPRILRV